MREYERYEPVQPAPRPVEPSRPAPQKRPVRVNKAAIVLGDPVMIFGALLQVLSRRKR